MKNISLKRECNADQNGIFFIDIKTQFAEIFGENIGNYFEKYQSFIMYIFTYPSFQKGGEFYYYQK